MKLTTCHAIGLLFFVALGLALAGSVSAAPVFSSSFDDTTGLTIVADADTVATFGYDYSADGIPEAPNNVGGAATTGLKLEANLMSGAAAEAAAVTTGLTMSGKYTVQADIWANFSIADGSSTEFAGAGVGHGGVATGRDGASLMFTGDGGSSRDYRLYKDDGEQFFGSLQYGPALASNNGSDPAISAAFPGLAPPAAQGQAGTSDDGDGGFQWMTMLIEVDTEAIGSGVTADPGEATFTLTSAASGNTLVIGTIDNSNGGAVVNMSGNASVIYADLFDSIAGDPQFQFGIFDNMVVTQIPEPGSVALLCCGALGLVGFRRRRR